MAYARKTPNGSWRGVAKQGRTTLATKTFKLKREAMDWANRIEAVAEGGLDVKAGRVRASCKCRTKPNNHPVNLW